MEVFINNESSNDTVGYSRSCCFMSKSGLDLLKTLNGSEDRDLVTYLKAQMHAIALDNRSKDNVEESRHCHSALLLVKKRADIVDPKHVLVPNWLQFVTAPSVDEISPISSNISIEYFSTTPMRYDKLHLTLELVNAISLRHWSDSANTARINSKSNVSDSNYRLWPSHISKRVLEKLAPTLLSNEHISLQSLVAIEALESILICKISSIRVKIDESSGFENVSDGAICGQDSVFIIRPVNTSIEFIESDDGNNHNDNDNEIDSYKIMNSKSNSNSNIKDIVQLIREGYISNFFSKFRHIIHSFIKTNTFNNIPMCSLLISGSEGSGKTEIINNLREIIEDFAFKGVYGIDDEDLTCNGNSVSSKSDVYVISMEFSQSKGLRSSDNTAKSRKCELLSSPNSIFNNIVELMDLLEVDSSTAVSFKSFYENSSSNSLKNSVIVIALDSIDEIFDAHMEIVKEYSSFSNIKHALEVSFVLSNLIKSVHKQLSIDGNKSSNPRNIKFIIVSTCRRQKSLIPASNTSAPSFDMIIELSRLKFNDRKLLFRTILSKYKASLELIQNDNEGNVISSEVLRDGVPDLDKNLNLWSTLSAQLTAGCRPGDIVSIISHWLDMHIGIMQSSETESRNNSKKILNEWKFSLLAKAISLTPPKLLSRLQNLQIGAELQTYREKLTWNDFCGYSDIKHRVSDLLCRLNSEKTMKLAQDFGLVGSGRGFVLTGPSGCGKSYLAKVMASVVNMNIITINSTEILSKYFGETEQSIRILFKAAKESSPCLLFFDEFDAISCKRSVNNENSSSGNLNTRVLSTFLNELDGVSTDSNSSSLSNLESNVIIVVACESISMLDDALIRPGRLSHHIELKKPGVDSIKEILKYKLAFRGGSDSSNSEKDINYKVGIPCSNEVNIDILAQHLLDANASCADIDGLCREAAYSAIRRYITLKGSSASGSTNIRDAEESLSESNNEPYLCWEDFLAVMNAKI